MSPQGAEGAGLGDADAEGEADADVDEGTLQEEAPQTSEPGERNDTIRVFARVRPPSAHEGSAPCRDIVRVDASQSVVHLLAEPLRKFAFDGVLGESSTQEQVFQLAGTSVGEACLSGYNGSIYVYGQTGSGKTHTMQGPVSALQTMQADDRRGMMCRMLDFVFGEVARRHAESGSVQYNCKCSYLEIYKEQITDLLEPSSTNLQVREDINRGIYVERLSEHSAWTVADAFHVLWKGLHQRHVGATQMNELSSRSHAVFTLALEATSTTSGGVTTTRVARLNLIDLAGSERQSFDPHNPTLHESLRVKEAGAINKSLSALTNVIMSLSQAGPRRRNSFGGAGAAPGQPRRPFVRYRDSKLTFLLRDSLGGNSKTIIVACVSPSALCFGETLSTLKFAARAKHIRCAAVMNEEYSGTVESLSLEVKSLKQQLELLSSRGLIPADTRLSLASLGGAQSGASDNVLRSRGRRPSVIGPSDIGDDDAIEGLLARASEEYRRLYGTRRVRRLEILLAAALERERRCELKRHKLDKFTQYLNGLLERKEQYFDALRDYFAFLVDHAAGDACYLPQLTARLIVFRKQLCSLASESKKNNDDMLNGAIDAFLANEAGRRPMASASATELGAQLPHQDVVRPSVPRSQSYAYGIMMAEAAQRECRRGSAMMHMRASTSRLLASGMPIEGLAGAPPATLGAAPGGGGRPGNCLSQAGQGGAVDEELAVLRAENRLLRRQVESHPELHRLGTENRLLREHLASLAQQQALAYEEPPWPKAHRRRGPEGLGGAERGMGISRVRSLTRTSKSSLLVRGGGGSQVDTKMLSGAEGPTARLVGTFPSISIHDATQISASSSSAGSEEECSDLAPEAVGPGRQGDGAGRGGGRRGRGGSNKAACANEAASFLPTMAFEVEQLYRARKGLEDSLKQLLCRQARSAQGSLNEGAVDLMQASVEDDDRVTSEILRTATEALSFAEGMLAKSKSEAVLLVGRKDGGETQGASHWGQRSPLDGLDERDVFLSLMRSLPSDGARAAAAPQLARLGASLLGGPAGARLFRNQSTMQLHCIAESPHSSHDEALILGGSATKECGSWESAPAGGDASLVKFGEGACEITDLISPSTMLHAATEKVHQLTRHLEIIGEAYREMREQLRPLQDEYARRLDECRFLEAQCRRLDVHCRLLEERAASLEGSAAGRLLSLAAGAAGAAGGVNPSSSLWQRLADSPGPSIPSPPVAAPGAGLLLGVGAGLLPSGAALPAAPGAAAVQRPWAWGVVPTPAPGNAGRSAPAGGSLPLGLAVGGCAAGAPAMQRVASQASVASQHSMPATYQASGQEMLVRRVVSAPQLPGAQQAAEAAAGAAASAAAGAAAGAAAEPPGGGAQLGGAQGGGSSSAAPGTLTVPPAPGVLGTAGDTAFQTSVFLSLARQPGPKDAALQYLLSSTSSALQNVAAPREVTHQVLPQGAIAALAAQGLGGGGGLSKSSSGPSAAASGSRSAASSAEPRPAGFGGGAAAAPLLRAQLQLELQGVGHTGSQSKSSSARHTGGPQQVLTPTHGTVRTMLSSGLPCTSSAGSIRAAVQQAATPLQRPGVGRQVATMPPQRQRSGSHVIHRAVSPGHNV